MIAQLSDSLVAAGGGIIVASITAAGALFVNLKRSNTKDHEHVVQTLSLLHSDLKTDISRVSTQVEKVSTDFASHMGWHSAQATPTPQVVVVAPSTVTPPITPHTLTPDTHITTTVTESTTHASAPAPAST